MKLRSVLFLVLIASSSFLLLAPRVPGQRALAGAWLHKSCAIASGWLARSYSWQICAGYASPEVGGDSSRHEHHRGVAE